MSFVLDATYTLKSTNHQFLTRSSRPHLRHGQKQMSRTGARIHVSDLSTAVASQTTHTTRLQVAALTGALPLDSSKAPNMNPKCSKCLNMYTGPVVKYHSYIHQRSMSCELHHDFQNRSKASRNVNTSVRSSYHHASDSRRLRD